MHLYFGPVDNPDLKAYSTQLIGALSYYVRVLNLGLNRGEHHLQFSDVPPFQLAEGRPYTAKTKVPFILDGKPAGELAAVFLRPGEGTGDLSTYRRPLCVSRGITSNPENIGVVPRAKPHDIEFAFPLFSAVESYAGLGVGSVLELTVDRPPEHPHHPTQIEIMNTLGDSRRFMESVNTRKDMDPVAYLILDKLVGNFGDPHAIYNPEMLAIAAPAVGQVWGFVQAERGEVLHDRLMRLVDATRASEDSLRAERRRSYEASRRAEAAEASPNGAV